MERVWNDDKGACSNTTKIILHSITWCPARNGQEDLRMIPFSKGSHTDVFGVSKWLSFAGLSFHLDSELYGNIEDAIIR